MAERCLIERDEIRAWIEERGGKPAVIRGAQENSGRENPELLHIVFGDDGQSWQEISWNEFFDRLEGSDLALLVDAKRGRRDFSFVDRNAALGKYNPESERPDSGDAEMLRGDEYPSDPPHAQSK